MDDSYDTSANLNDMMQQLSTFFRCQMCMKTLVPLSNLFPHNDATGRNSKALLSEVTSCQWMLITLIGVTGLREFKTRAYYVSLPEPPLYIYIYIYIYICKYNIQI